MSGDPTKVRVGPGWIYIAPLDSTEPTDVISPLDGAWTNLGYTDGGTTFTFGSTFEDIEVDQEYDPIAVLQTKRTIAIDVEAAEMTADNLEVAFNGGDVVGPAGGVTTFEPPETGVFTYVMLLWEHIDGLERWLFRKCLQTGSVAIARKKAPDKATVPLSFRAVKPADAPAFQAFFDSDYEEGSGS